MKQPQPADMDREDIKAAIRKTGITLNDLSRRHGYSVAAVRMTLKRPSPAVQAIIASHLGRKPQDIWPSRYDADGEPLRGVRSNKRDTSRLAAAPHRQKHEAA